MSKTPHPAAQGRILFNPFGAAYKGPPMPPVTREEAEVLFLMVALSRFEPPSSLSEFPEALGGQLQSTLAKRKAMPRRLTKTEKATRQRRYQFAKRLKRMHPNEVFSLYSAAFSFFHAADGKDLSAYFNIKKRQSFLLKTPRTVHFCQSGRS